MKPKPHEETMALLIAASLFVLGVSNFMDFMECRDTATLLRREFSFQLVTGKCELKGFKNGSRYK